MLDVLREDYIRTAWAKGQCERIVVFGHALRNATLPVITVIGIEFAFMIGGLVVTETVFNLPGVARYLVDAILWRDYPVVQNLVMFIAIVVILANLTVDLLYGWLDRASATESGKKKYGYSFCAGNFAPGEPEWRFFPFLPRETAWSAGRSSPFSHGTGSRLCRDTCHP